LGEHGEPVWLDMPDRHQKSMEPALNRLKGAGIYSYAVSL